MDDALRATFAVVRTLEVLGLDYLIGGSLASSLHGIPRSTQDADLLVDLPSARVAELVAALEGRFYVDEERVHEAVSREASFNVIHLATMFKVDLFVLGQDPLGRSEMRRRERHRIGEPPEAEAFVATAEDTVLQKLLWYRLGSRVSDRQWLDIIGVLQVQGERLDQRYLGRWARGLGLESLLQEALLEAGRGAP